MDAAGRIDVDTDFQEDSRRRDPNLSSPLLQEFHRRLWSKPLPNGRVFELTPGKVRGAHVLYHRTPTIEFTLSGDTLANSSRGLLRSFYDAGDLVDDGGEITFYGPFDDFAGRVFPDSMKEYRGFREGQLAFAAARNARIRATTASDRISGDERAND